MKKGWQDRSRDDPFPLFIIGFFLLVGSFVPGLLGHGTVVGAIAATLFVLAWVAWAACAWFGISGYRRRTGRSQRGT